MDIVVDGITKSKALRRLYVADNVSVTRYDNGEMFRAIPIAIAVTIAAPIAAMTEPACGLYRYKAKIISVTDGDTVRADIDLGFNTWRHNEPLRLYGINTPERRGGTKVAWQAAKTALESRILGKEVVICTIKDKREKYGRYLAQIYIGDELINDWLLKKGYAEPYMP